MKVNVKGDIFFGTDDVFSRNFIYYFRHWRRWTIDDHVDVNGHYDTADCNK